jgi:hypothetical protein
MCACQWWCRLWGWGICGCVHGRVGILLGSGAGKCSERAICRGTGLGEWHKIKEQGGSAGKGSSGGRVG